MKELINKMQLIPFFEMGIKKFVCNFDPSKTAWGKKVDAEKIKKETQRLKEIKTRDKASSWI